VPRERTFWLVLGSLILVGLVAGLFRGGPETVRLSLASGAPAPVAQERGKRVWRTEPFAPVAAVPAGEGQPLQLPTLLRTDGRGDVYVLDSGDLRVKKLAADGRIVVAYGAADLGNPTDFAVASDGEVWVVEPDQKRITVFAPAGAVARRIGLEESPMRLGLNGTGGFVATHMTGSEGFFHRYSRTGEPAGSFAALFPERFQNALALDGWLVPTGAQSFVYLFRNAGLLAAFTTDGQPLFFRRTIEPVPLPEVRIDVAGVQSVSRDAPLASISGSTAGGELWVLSAQGRGERVLDVYDAGTGTYRYSVAPPEKDARYVVVTAGRLFSASARGVTIWRRDRNPAPGSPPPPNPRASGSGGSPRSAAAVRPPAARSKPH
jgi:hypothetical protein